MRQDCLRSHRARLYRPTIGVFSFPEARSEYVAPLERDPMDAFWRPFSSEKKTKCVCWDPPFLANSVTFRVSRHRGRGKPIIVDAIRCGSQSFFGYALFQIELPIGFTDIQ